MTRGRLLFVMAIVAVAAVAGASSVATGTASDRAGTERIAFVRDLGLYLMDADGRNQRRVRGFAVQGFPSWSPDGRRLAFTNLGKRARIWIANANGTQPRPATPAGNYDCLWLVWSPNSKRLAYTRNENCEGYLHVFVVEAHGGRPRLLSRGFRSLDPAWAPTSRTIVYTSSPTNGERMALYLRHLNRGASRRIPKTKAAIINSGLPSRPTAIWAPSGKSIFFLGPTGGGFGLFSLTLDGRAPRLLTAGLPQVTSFDLSRDGRRVALGVREAGSGQIYSMNADGTDRHRLTELRTVHGTDPRWSPAGRKLIFVSRPRGVLNTDIYVMNPDGSDKQNLTRSAGADRAPAWSVVR